MTEQTKSLDLTPPPSRREDVVESIHGVEVADPYRWLEDGTSEETIQWMQAQNAYSDDVIGRRPEKAWFAERLADLFTEETVEKPVVRGNTLFFQRRGGSKPQPVLLMRDLPDGREEVLVDPNVEGSEGQVSLDWWFPSPDGRLLAFGLSEAGTEGSTLFVLDVARQLRLDDTIPRTQHCSLAWLPDGTGFYYTRHPKPNTVPAGEEKFHRRVYFHRIGTNPDDDPLIYGDGRPMTESPDIALCGRGRYLAVFAHQRPGGAQRTPDAWGGPGLPFYTPGGVQSTDIFVYDVGRDGGAGHDASGRDAVGHDASGRDAAGHDAAGHDAAGHGEAPTLVFSHVGGDSVFFGSVVGEKLYALTNHGAPRYRLVAIDFTRPEPENWQEVVPSSATVTWDDFVVAGDMLFLTAVEDAAGSAFVCALDGSGRRRVNLPGLGTVASVSSAGDEPIVCFTFESFLLPPAIYALNVRDGELNRLMETPTEIDADSIHVERVFVASKGGARVPMFILHRKDLDIRGECPTVMTGYGGFYRSILPRYDRTVYPWLQQGGVYVSVNLRGGGEYGTDWHRAGMLGNKQNVFDDFVAAAEHLIERGYTNPRRLGMSGRSNGGLLVGAVMTQRPDLFSAAVCGVPVLDMVRFPKFLIGRLWIPEYGDPENPEHFRWLYEYSPYHNVRQGEPYPVTYFYTSESDPRVDPLHARKMVAALQHASPNHPILLRVHARGGHGQGKSLEQFVDEQTEAWTVLAWALQLPVPTGGSDR